MSAARLARWGSKTGKVCEFVGGGCGGGCGAGCGGKVTVAAAVAKVHSGGGCSGKVTSAAATDVAARSQWRQRRL